MCMSGDGSRWTLSIAFAIDVSSLMLLLFASLLALAVGARYCSPVGAGARG
jgi:hypothetical protein